MTWLTGADGQRIFYQEQGSGRPIVFSHGWPLCSDDWRVQLELFAQHGFRTVAHDRRGHGRSPAPTSGNDMDAYARDLGELLEQLDLRDAVLVGHSTGGGEVARYASLHGSRRQRVAKLVLVGSVTPSLLRTPSNPDGVPMDVFNDARMAIERDRSQYYQLLPKPYFFGSRRTAKGVTDALCQEFWREGMLGDAAAQRECIRAFSETDFSEDLARIDVPTLIIHGDDDVLVPLDATARRAVQSIANARLEIYEAAPHGLVHTHRDRFNADLLAFIRA